MSTSSVSGSSTVNGLHSNANVISGLVSGLDTESMIEGLVDAYNQKIIGYQQSIVTQQWKQNAYRDVISDLQAFASKYTSFTSQSSNVSSQSFFNSAISTVTNGENAGAVSVSGSTSASVSVDAVLQTASASKIISSSLSEKYNNMDTATGDEVDLEGKTDVGLLSGSMSFTYGSTKVSISFSDKDVLDTKDGTISNAEAMANLINEKLKDKTIGDEVASTKFQAVADASGNISFEDKTSGGNAIWISSAGSALKETLGITTSYSEYSKDATTFKMSDDIEDYVETKGNMSLISEKTITVNYNGSSVSLTIPSTSDYMSNLTPGESYADYLTNDLNEQLEKQFGGEVTVANIAEDKDGLQLEFTIDANTNGNTLTVSSSVGEYLGFGGTSIKNSIQTSDTLDKILGDDVDFGSSMEIVSGQTVEKYNLASGTAFVSHNGTVTYNSSSKTYTDSDGDTVVKLLNSDKTETWVKLNDDGELRVGKEVEINGEVVGVFDGESTLQDVMDAINNSDAGATVAFSSLTNNFVFESKETGASSAISIGGSLGDILFGTTGETTTMVDSTYTSADIAGATAKSTIGTEFKLELTINDTDYSYKVGDTVNGTTITSGMTYENVVNLINKDLENTGVEISTSQYDANGDIVLDEGNSSDALNLYVYTSAEKGEEPEINVSLNGDKIIGADYEYTSTKTTTVEGLTSGYDTNKFHDDFELVIGDGDDAKVLTQSEMDDIGLTYSVNADGEFEFTMVNGDSELNLEFIELRGKSGGDFESAEITEGEVDVDVETTEYGTVDTTEEDVVEGESEYLQVSQGQNAIMVTTVNGEQLVLERSSNVFEIEGLKVTANSVFNNTDANGDTLDLTADNWSDNIGDLVIEDEITFSEEKDFDPIIEVIREMVDSYNELMSKIKTYFTEVPLTTTDGTGYLPLTDDDRNSMTESAVESYEEKAKTGILFGDSNMRSLYNSMSTIFSTSGAYGIDLYNMGFSVGYGTTSTGEMVDFDEEKLREMMETDYDTVIKAFTSTTANGAVENGVMAKLSSSIEMYSSVTGSTKGILVNQAGSELSSLSLLNNTMENKIEAFQELITAWEDKLSNKVDFYTSQFSKLEILMSNANSQSSALAGLNGY